MDASACGSVSDRIETKSHEMGLTYANPLFFDGEGGGGSDVGGHLMHLLESAGLDPSLAGLALFTGRDPLYATPYCLGAAASVAIAAVGIAYRMLVGRETGFTVDLPHSALSTQSFRYLKLNGLPVVSPRNALTGFYRCGDDTTIFLHLNFPHHRARTQQVLGMLDGHHAIAERVLKWRGIDLVQAIIDAGSCAALVQSFDAWGRCEQAQVIAALPPVAVSKIASSTPEPLNKSRSQEILRQIAVVDCTRVLAGPVSGRTLAELGADVTRVEHPSYPDLLSYELDTGRNKAVRRLDLGQPSERDQLMAMVRRADVFQQAFRPGVVERFGLTPEALSAFRPGLIYTSLSAFGHQGPWGARRGFDSVVQAATGLALTQGEGIPRLLPTSPIDYVSGYLMAFGTLVALKRREVEGGSYVVRCSLARTAQWISDFGLVSRPTEAEEQFRVSALVDKLSVQTSTQHGRLTHLQPVLRALNARCAEEAS